MDGTLFEDSQKKEMDVYRMLGIHILKTHLELYADSSSRIFIFFSRLAMNVKQGQAGYLNMFAPF